MTLILQVGKQKPREVKAQVQGHMGKDKVQNWDLNPHSLALNPTPGFKCGPRTTSTSSPWEPVSSARSQIRPKPTK